jgi:acetyltransferase-like isoleucine patch superfamily enzyme
MIANTATIGKSTVIFHPELVNIYGATIGEGCKIGAFVEIKPNVTIGNNVKIEPMVFIPNGVTIEDGVFIGPGVTFTNDRFPSAVNANGSIKSERDWQVEKTLVQKGAAIGAGSTIRCGITIGEGALVGAGSVVTKDVRAKTTVVGNPAKLLKKSAVKHPHSRSHAGK